MPIKILSFLLINLILVANVYAAPTINSTSGTFTTGQSVNISGSGFGIKTTAKPLVYADFASSTAPNGTLGQTSSWAATGHCLSQVTGSECPDGSGSCIRSTDGSEACFDNGGVILGVDQTSWNTAGNYIYIYQKKHYNYTTHPDNYHGVGITDNYKNYRAWPTDPVNLPDWYISINNNRTAFEAYNEDITLADNNIDLPILPFPQEWFVEEFLIHVGDPWPAVNGNWILYRDGDQKFSHSMCLRGNSGSADDVDITRFYVVHEVPDFSDDRWPCWSTDNRFWADDVYVDTTWSRVMICAGSTWTNRGHCEIQIPSAWSDTSSTVTVESGTITGTNYLYVVDASNTANSSGYQVTIGEGSSPMHTMQGTSISGGSIR